MMRDPLSPSVPPAVTVAIPVLNEEQYLDACIESIISGIFPVSQIEVVIIDGGSTDRSQRIAESWIERLPSSRILHNRERIQAAGLNLALQGAQGEFFVRIDAHSTYQPDYVSTCVRLLDEGKAENVGGIQRPIGHTTMQKTIALTLRSPFAMGLSVHRHAKKPSYGESVYLGAWKTATLRELGGFDESLEIAEDFDLNIRMARSGKRILVLPELAPEYHVRKNLVQLSVQYFRYGLWKTRILRRYPRVLKLRHLMPALLMLTLLSSIAVSPISWQMAILVPLTYTLVTIVATLAVLVDERDKLALGGLIVFPMLHLSYGAGFLWGVLTDWLRRTRR